MIRNLLLSGGPAHDFDALSRAVAAALVEQGIETSVVTRPDDALVALRSAEAGTAAPVDLLTVCGLHWGMAAERYAHLRESCGYTLGADDAAVIDRFVRAGGGLLALHTAVICFDAEPAWRDLCGAAWDWTASSHPPLGEVTVAVTPSGRDHPVTEGLGDFTLVDEVYGFLDELPGLDPLLRSTHGGRAHPVLWAREVGSGRVVTDLLGHGPESLEHPVHRTILGRAAAWARPNQEERR